MRQSINSRRRFLVATSALVVPMIAPSSILGASGTAPGSRITIGVIGLGAAGTRNLVNFLQQQDVQVVAVCDVHDLHYRDMEKGKKLP